MKFFTFEKFFKFLMQRLIAFMYAKHVYEMCLSKGNDFFKQIVYLFLIKFFELFFDKTKFPMLNAMNYVVFNNFLKESNIDFFFYQAIKITKEPRFE